MAILRDDPAGGSGARVVDGHLQVSQEHMPPGFVPVQFHAIAFTASPTEALLTLTPQRDFVAGTPATSHAVTAGKRLKLNKLVLVARNAGAAAQGAAVRLRVSPSGAAIVTSPIVATCGVTTPGAIAAMAQSVNVDLEGIDITGTAQLAVTQLGQALAGFDCLLRGYEYVI